MELIFSLGTWLIISSGAILLWGHVVRSGNVPRQYIFENARGAMDTLRSNMELSHTIAITTTDAGAFVTMVVEDLNPEGMWHDYLFEMAGEVLRFGENELAHSVTVYMAAAGDGFVAITIYTTCDDPLRLHSLVDARFKNVVFIPQ